MAKTDAEETKKVEPKPPRSMSNNEIIEQMNLLKEKMRRAASNFEFYYYYELETQLNELKKELESRRGEIS